MRRLPYYSITAKMSISMIANSFFILYLLSLLLNINSLAPCDNSNADDIAYFVFSDGEIYFKLIKLLTEMISACSRLAFAYPEASSAEVVFFGPNLFFDKPLIISFAAIK